MTEDAGSDALRSTLVQYPGRWHFVETGFTNTVAESDFFAQRKESFEFRTGQPCLGWLARVGPLIQHRVSAQIAVPAPVTISKVTSVGLAPRPRIKVSSHIPTHVKRHCLDVLVLFRYTQVPLFNALSCLILSDQYELLDENPFSHCESLNLPEMANMVPCKKFQCHGPRWLCNMMISIEKNMIKDDMQVDLAPLLDRHMSFSIVA